MFCNKQTNTKGVIDVHPHFDSHSITDWVYFQFKKSESQTKQCHRRKLNEQVLMANRTSNTQRKRTAKHQNATSAFTYQTKNIFKSHIKI